MGTEHSELPTPHSTSLAIVFHKLTNRLTFGINNCPPNKFRRIFDYLQQHGLELADIEITFDDGYAHLAENLPPLIKWYGIRPIIFVPTAFIGRNNRWDYSSKIRKESHLNEHQIVVLSQLGVRFGSHGHTHSDLTCLDEVCCRRELERSKRILEEILGETVDTISYPFGRYNRRVLELAIESGYNYGYTMSFPSPKDSSHRLGRYPVYRFDTPSCIKAKLSPGVRRALLKTASHLIGSLSRGTIAYQKISAMARERD